MNLRSTSLVENNVDPSNPSKGLSWIKTIGQVGQPGQAIGFMGLTYSQPEIDYCKFKYKTNEGKIVSMDLK